MRFPTLSYVRPAKILTRLRIRAVRAEPLLVAQSLEYSMNIEPFGASKLNMRLHMLVGVCTCQNTTLLEITSSVSYNK